MVQLFDVPSGQCLEMSCSNYMHNSRGEKRNGLQLGKRASSEKTQNKNDGTFFRCAQKQCLLERDHHNALSEGPILRKSSKDIYVCTVGVI